MGWNGVTVAVASEGAQTINGPGAWLELLYPPSSSAQAMSRIPNAISAAAKIGFRHLNGNPRCLSGLGVG